MAGRWSHFGLPTGKVKKKKTRQKTLMAESDGEHQAWLPQTDPAGSSGSWARNARTHSQILESLREPGASTGRKKKKRRRNPKNNAYGQGVHRVAPPKMKKSEKKRQQA
jgi:hypothetical protein